MAGKLLSLSGEFPTLNDWENHLTTIYPEVCSLCGQCPFFCNLLYLGVAVEFGTIAPCNYPLM